MRVNVKKYLFIGLREEQEHFFKEAQKAGIVHFIDRRPKVYRGGGKESEQIAEAIKVLRSLPTQEQEEIYPFEQREKIVQEILSLHSKVHQYGEQLRALKLEKERVEVFGDFSLEDVAYIERRGKKKLQFYCVALSKNFSTEEPNLFYVGSSSGLKYFVAINSKPRQYPPLIEMKIDKPVGLLTREIDQIKKEKLEAERSLKAYGKYEQFLHEALKESLNSSNLTAAQECASEPLDLLFTVEGWVPTNKVRKLKQWNVHVEEVATEKSDVVPTYLENRGFSKIGEDLVHIYDTPSPKDRDPSLWVLGFFALFFSMIVGDAGYGLIFLAISLYLRVKYSIRRGAARRAVQLFTLLSVASILWGVTNGSFFGVTLRADHPLRKVSAITWLAHKKAEYHIAQQDSTFKSWKHPQKRVEELFRNEEIFSKLSDNVFLEMVLLIAVAHISLSLLRYLPRNWPAIGWLCFLVGAVLYVPYKFIDAVTVVQYLFAIDVGVAMKIGAQLMGIGFITALFLSLLQNRWMGLLEPMTVVQIFSDVMSYLRLYALGLAGALVSATINEMFYAVPFVFGVLLLLIGHTLNIVLAISGGVIHGLRLNFLEWYHYSFEGGGRLFNPLTLLEVAKRKDQFS